MGFIDNGSRVIDFVLTERGRELFARGELDFEFYCFFDDGIDYGSDVPDAPMLEVPYISNDRLAPRSHLFKASAGYTDVPHLSSPSDGDSFGLQCTQANLGGDFIRSGANTVVITPSHTGETVGDDGYIMTVYTVVSGSEPRELAVKHDLAGRRSFDPFITVSVDEETGGQK